MYNEYLNENGTKWKIKEISVSCSVHVVVNVVCFADVTELKQN